MGETIDHTEHLATLLRLLPPVPHGWGQAAQELPAALDGLEDLVARATEDAALHARIVAGLEQALAAEGIEPSPIVIEALRRRLDG